MEILEKEDFSCVGMVAKHCDFSKLCIAEDEALIFDLSELFCDFWNDILTYWQEVEDYDANPDLVIPENYEEKKNLIFGGNFNGCGGGIATHLGVKRVLIYYTYSRYILLNGFNDTPSGMVQKTNEWSIPKPLNEVQTFSDKYRNMGYLSYKKTLNFLCHNREIFTNFKAKDCEKCGCECDSCNGSTKVRGYGIKSAIIKK